MTDDNFGGTGCRENHFSTPVFCKKNAILLAFAHSSTILYEGRIDVMYY